jgi:hypothetical protein
MKMPMPHPIREAIRLFQVIVRFFLSMLSFQAFRVARQRVAFDKDLSQLHDKHRGETRAETVLIDGSWDNPHFWVRVSFMRAVLSPKREVGFLGPHRRREQLATFERLGITHLEDIRARRDTSERNRDWAREQCSNLTSPDDILDWSLPSELPAMFLYDYLLKNQRHAFVNIDSPTLESDIAFFLDCLTQSEAILDRTKPDTVLMSHAVGWPVTMVWAALARNIPVFVLYGDFGVLRFWRISGKGGVYDFQDRPGEQDKARLNDSQRKCLEAVGESYLQRRLEGDTSDIGGTFAYTRRQATITRDQICQKFQWDPTKPIVGCYAANWFDFPHTFGMSRFRDFYDWIVSSLEAMKGNTDVNWLFKAHPCDEWYGGATLADMIDFDTCQHVKLASMTWNGRDMIDAIDAFTTYHGSIGIEATAFGKPVLVPDRGWYDDWGFVQCGQSRSDYLDTLNRTWWRDMDVEKNARSAKLFAGWFWARPRWQDDYLFEDDSQQWTLYPRVRQLMATSVDAIDTEIETLRAWCDIKGEHYHTFKMLQSEEYTAL